MKAFLEEFHGYLVRVGPDAEKMGDDYFWSFPVDFGGNFQGVSTKTITKEAHDHAVRAVNEKLQILTSYERLGDNPGKVVQVSGVNDRRIVMHKQRNFTKSELKKSHVSKGNYDRATVSADMRKVADANDANQVSLITRRMSIGEASNGSGKKSQHIFLEWEINDPELTANPE